MKFQVRLFLVAIVALSLIPGCKTSQSPHSDRATPRSVVTQTQMPIKTQSNVIVSTPTTNAIPSTITYTPSPQIITQCSIVAPTLTGDFLNDGTLGIKITGIQGVSVLGTQDQSPRLLIKNQSVVFMSPYTGTFAWIDSINDLIIFRKSDGTELHRQWDASYGIPWQWFPDERVMLRNYEDRDFESHRAQDTIHIINIDSGQVIAYHFNFWGDYGYSGSFISSGGRRTVQYDPNLSLVIYAYNDPESSDQGILLWEIETEQLLWKGIQPTDPSLIDSNWQLNGEYVVVNHGNTELFQIMRDGTAAQLTHLSQSGLKGYLVQEPLWSPDRRYIAFIFVEDFLQPLSTRLLYILDTLTGKIIDYCFPGPVGYHKAWSPDSRQIAFIINSERLVILDIGTGQAQSMEGVSELYGWYSGIID
jgi:hypothetical protein